MLKKVLIIIPLAITGIVLIAAAAIYGLTALRLSRTYTVEPPPLSVAPDPNDAALVERGGYLLSAVTACADCHGADFGGGTLLEDPLLGNAYGPNLTRGAGGVGARFSDADWVRAIRHGIGGDGRNLIIMPSYEFYNFTERDLAAVIAYLKTVPPVDRTMPRTAFGPLGRTLLLAGLFPAPAVEMVDHDAPMRQTIAAGPGAEYGGYLASLACMGCHKPDLSGGPLPGAPPDALPAADLRPSGPVGGWTEAQFVQTIRTGVDPAGKVLDHKAMPWPFYMNMTDADLQAIYAYLHNLAPAQTAEAK